MSTKARRQRRMKAQLERLTACPDCRSDVQARIGTTEVFAIAVEHDTTCQTFNAVAGGEPFRVLRVVPGPA